jgi:oligo-1,6-glucosidase
VPIPPNNWAQILGDANSAWTYSEETDEFFLSLFTPEQPDLNWENPDVRAAVHDVMLYWIEKGCCGFRMDVINLISKDQSFPDAPQNLPPGHKYQDGSKFFVNGPRLHEFLRALNREVLSKHDTITVGEMPGISDPSEILRTVGQDAGELNMIFIFDIVDIDNQPPGPKFTYRPFDARDIARITDRWQTVMLERNGWNSLFVNNHDQPRAVSRYADDSDRHREKGAKLIGLMQTTLAGTLYVYQGEELGLRNLPGHWDPATDYKDVEALNFWKKSQALHGDDPEALARARMILEKKARDHARSPMHWDASANAGFCEPGAKPWMRLNDDYEEVNAKRQTEEPGESFDGGMSVWQFYQRALKCRKDNRDVFVYGAYEQVGKECEPGRVFAYRRGAVAGAGGARFLTVLNFSGDEVRWKIPHGDEVAKWVAGNYGPGNIEDVKTEGEIVLRPWEGVLGVGR